ncbi:MAG TPA: hypothetical protein VGI40_21740 [Pirellulaceae bacterium]
MLPRVSWPLLGFLYLAGVCLAQDVPAFPGAEGDGQFATGGRGGQVVHVTNLAPSGPGSLADCVSQPNRIVVFDVSGIIDLTPTANGSKQDKKLPKKIAVAHPNITIVGQTAPGEGICIKGGTLTISADNVIVRHIRCRRGWNYEGDSGDALEIKPIAKGVQTQAEGVSPEEFEKTKLKKEERGKQVSEFDDLNRIVIDHCSTSWATDENLTVTHAGQSTISWSFAAEGCDYANPKQTPPNHSEGSLWGSAAPNGRSTMHHMLYAHNRLRNPRTTGGDDQPPVLTFYNNVIYNWSEYPTHTGSQRVHLQWLNNFYKAGPSTPSEIAAIAFEFHGDPLARLYASGNIIDGSPSATANNRLAVGYSPSKFKNVSAADRAAMVIDQPWSEPPAALQTAADAFESVLADGGATLPARDMVDVRIANSVRTGRGAVIRTELDLPADERCPDYRSLPKPVDSDNDGIPDYWEQQYGLDPTDSSDSAKISAGYANIEHYFNNTDPRGESTPIISVSAIVPRAQQGQPAVWRLTRSGDTSKSLTVNYTLSGDAISGRDFAPLAGTATFAARESSLLIRLQALPAAHDEKVVILTLPVNDPDYKIGCPPQSLALIRNVGR